VDGGGGLVGRVDAAHVGLDLRNIRNTRLGLVAVEDLGNLLERGTLGLDVEEVDDDELEGDPAAVNGVEFPAGGESLEADGVDVPVGRK